MRGYISSKLIQALNTATGGKLLDKVDGFAGTSTGGLISIALANNVSIDTVVDIYTNDAATIFTKNGWLTKEELQARFEAQAGGQPMPESPGILGSAYKATGLVKILSPHLGTTTIGQLKKLLAVNTAQLWDTSRTPNQWMPQTLNTEGVGGDFSNVQLLDAALATSAAPAYFPPHDIPGFGYFADGGTFANNPVLNGIEVALSKPGVNGLADIEIISIGTGVSPEGIPPKAITNPLDWGASYWMRPWARDGAPAFSLLNLTLDAASQNLGKITENILHNQLVRINPVLSKAVALDEYTKADYQIMDEAIDAVINGQNTYHWNDAIDMVNRW